MGLQASSSGSYLLSAKYGKKKTRKSGTDTFTTLLEKNFIPKEIATDFCLPIPGNSLRRIGNMTPGMTS